MKTRRRSLIAGACVALIATAACSTQGAEAGAESGPGVDTDAKVITVGNISALSGPAAALGAPLTKGLETFWEATNERGGVDGWTVEVQTEDSGYEPQRHVEIYNSLKSDVAMLASMGSPTTKAIQSLLDREKLVTTPQSFDSLWGSDLVLAPSGTPYSYDVANALDYVTQAGTKDLRVGIIYQNDEAGADAMRGFDQAEKTYGFQVAGKEPFKAGDADFTAQIQNLKSADADVVVVIGLPSSTGPIVGTAASLGYQPQWVLFGPAFVEQLMTEDGTQASAPTPVAAALEGALYTGFSAPWGDDSASAMTQMLADQKKWAPEQTPSVYFTLGYAEGLIQKAILEKAIASGDFSREGVYQAKISVGEIDMGGLQSNVTYTDEKAPPSRSTDIQIIDASQPGFVRSLDADVLGKAAETLELPSSS